MLSLGVHGAIVTPGIVGGAVDGSPPSGGATLGGPTSETLPLSASVMPLTGRATAWPVDRSSERPMMPSRIASTWILVVTRTALNVPAASVTEVMLGSQETSCASLAMAWLQ